MKKHWWDYSVAYQIYPRSFQDSNGDGIGDINGITQRLDYLNDLGVKIIWLSPIFKSPMVDGGYDVADYESVDEIFGENKDLDNLLVEAEKRGIKVLLDMVLNHTSDQHPWFKEAMKDPLGKAGQRYVIRKGINGNPPNNWRGYFGGSVWEPIPNTDLYYMHVFHVKQPDLNWENEEVRNDINAMMNRWCEKGIAGFRIDAIGNIKKNIINEHLEPDGIDGLIEARHKFVDQKGIDDFFIEMKNKVFKPHDCFTVAEIGVTNERLKQYIGDDGFFTTVFDFSYTDIDCEVPGDWTTQKPIDAKDLRERLFLFQTETQKIGQPCPYFENHDQPRSASKYLKTIGTNDLSKKMLAVLFLMMRGIPFIYQGQELGMENIKLDDINMYNDIHTLDEFDTSVKEGMNPEEALSLIGARSRDNSRTPMQWDDNKNASFSKVEPWFPLNQNYKQINAKAQMADENSVYNFYKKLISLRTKSEFSETLVYGEFVPVDTDNDFVMPYKRVYGDKTIFVIVNYSQNNQEFKIEGEWKTILNNYANNDNYTGSLRPYEAIILSN